MRARSPRKKALKDISKYLRPIHWSKVVKGKRLYNSESISKNIELGLPT